MVFLFLLCLWHTGCLLYFGSLNMCKDFIQQYLLLYLKEEDGIAHGLKVEIRLKGRNDIRISRSATIHMQAAGRQG